MVQVMDIIRSFTDSDGVLNAQLELQVSTSDELPALGGDVDGVKVLEGSFAQIVQADEPTVVTLDANGTWYPEQ